MRHSDNIAKLMELERRTTRSRRGVDPESWRDDAFRYADYRLRNDANTLGPQEDVVERRRVGRKRVVTQHGGSSNALAENVILLLFLCGTIYLMYQLTLYLLTQS